MQVFRSALILLGLWLISAAAAEANPVVNLASPQSTTIAPGGAVSLMVSASGAGSLTYQWRHNGRVLAGAQSAALAIPDALFGANGWYDVDVTDAAGTTRSEPLFLNVAPAVTQLRHWGNDYGGQAAGPTALTDVMRLGVGFTTSQLLTLHRDAMLTTWPWNNTPEPVPAGLTDVVAAAAANYSAVALKGDGTVTAWGYSTEINAVPVGLDRVVAIAVGQHHALALRNDGTVVAWGTGGAEAVAPSGLANVVAIAAANYVSVALQADGEVVVWGGNYFGESNVPAGTSDVVKISAQGATVLALKADGTVVAWGTMGSAGAAFVPEGLTDVVDIFSAGDHALALKADGSVVAWGANDHGQCDAPADLADVLALAGGYGFSLVLRDASADPLPTVITAPLTQSAVENDRTTLAVTATGVGPLTYQWRRDGVDIPGAESATLTFDHVRLSDAASYTVLVGNHRGSLESAAATLTVLPIPVVQLDVPAGQVVAPGTASRLAVTATGTGALRYQWYFRGRPIAGATAAELVRDATDLEGTGHYWVDVSDDIGTRRSAPLFLRVAPARTKVVEWGARYPNTAIDWSTVTDAVKIATDGETTIVLRADGTVQSLGAWAGVMPTDLDQVVDIAIGAETVCALRSDGTVVSWGTFGYEPPAGLSDVVALAVGRAFYAALRSDGSVVTWGGEYYGKTTPTDAVEIGADWNDLFVVHADGLLTNTSGSNGNVPFELDDVQRLFCSGRFIQFARRQDGSIVGWGSDYRGAARLPTTWSGLRELAAGEYHGVARLANGTVVAWGETAQGQSTVPDTVVNAIQVAAAGSVSYALCADDGAGAPAWSKQPVGARAVVGGRAQFQAQAMGAGPLTFQWQARSSADGTWADLAPDDRFSGERTAALAVRPDDLTWDGGQFRCRVTNAEGAAVSEAVTLAVRAPLVVTPLSATSQMCHPGDPASLRVAATGVGELHFQWLHNGRPMSGPGADSAQLELPFVGREDAGWYVAVVRDDDAAVSSPAFFVNVAPVGAQAVTWGYGAGVNDRLPTDLNNVVAVAGGNSFPLALRFDGTVVTSPYGQGSLIPAGLNDAVQVSVSTDVNTVLRRDGTITGWGYQYYAPAAEAVRDVVSLSPNGGPLALTRFGSVVSWGSYDRQVNDTVTAALRNVVAVGGSDSRGHKLVVTEDGRVYAWGWNDYGECDVPADLTDVVAVVAGDFHSLALKADGTVVAWGSNEYGETTVPAGLDHVIAIAASGRHSLALKDDGTVVAWGSDYSGESTLPAELGAVFGLSANYNTSFAVVVSGLADDVRLRAVTPRTTFIGGDEVALHVDVANTGNRVLGAGDTMELKSADGTVLTTAVLPRLPLWSRTGFDFTLTAAIELGAHSYEVRVADEGGRTIGEPWTVELTTVERLAQTITFVAPTDRAFTAEPIALNATADSGLPVEFAVVRGEARIEGNQLYLTGDGEIVLSAHQSGNERYAPADSGERTFAVRRTFASWQRAEFADGSGGVDASGAATADPDGDGLVNLLEYALGYDPHRTEAHELGAVSVAGDHWVYTYVRPVDRADLTFAVEGAETLNETWNGVTLDQQVIGLQDGFEVWSATYPGRVPQVFFRLHVTSQP